MMEDRWINLAGIYVNARYIISFRHLGPMTCYLLLGETEEHSFYDEDETGYKNIMHAVNKLTIEERAEIRKRVRERPPMRRDEDD